MVMLGVFSLILQVGGAQLAGRCSSSFLQGHPPSLRFGHPDVTTDDTAPLMLAPGWNAG